MAQDSVARSLRFTIASLGSVASREGRTRARSEKAAIRAHASAIGQRHSLTQRHVEVLEMVFLGYPNDEIARRLEIASSTVKTHLQAIFERTGLRSRLALMGLLFEFMQPAENREAASSDDRAPADASDPGAVRRPSAARVWARRRSAANSSQR